MTNSEVTIEAVKSRTTSREKGGRLEPEQLENVAGGRTSGGGTGVGRVGGKMHLEDVTI